MFLRFGCAAIDYIELPQFVSQLPHPWSTPEIFQQRCRAMARRIWLFIAGLFLSQTPGAKANDTIVGVMIVVFAAWRFVGGKTSSWITFGVGIWLLFAPWVLGYVSNASRWNDFAVGWAVLILAAWTGGLHRGRASVIGSDERRAA